LINDDLKQIVFDEIINSASISIKSLKNLQTTDKFFESITTPIINIASNKFTKGFCQERKIENIFKIIKDSLFDYNKIDDILISINNDQYDVLKEKVKIKVDNISHNANNNTFIIFQFIKYCVVKQNKANLTQEIITIIDEPLFDFFHKVYNISPIMKISKISTLRNSRTSKDVLPPLFDHTILDEEWYRVSFNIYYIYYMSRLYNDGFSVTMHHYKEFAKYTLTTNLEDAKKNIQFVYHQYLEFEKKRVDNVFVYIASFMIFNMMNELQTVERNEVIRIYYNDDDDDRFYLRKKLQDIYQEFKEILEKEKYKTGSKAQQILKYAKLE